MIASTGLIALVTAVMPEAAPPKPSQIYGGTDVEMCAWPTVVAMGNACTGTLIHPQVVLYAAHCGAGYSQVNFGEQLSMGTSIGTSKCVINPLWDGQPGGQDFAICVLAEPVDVPIIPILMGCETDYLVPGADVVSVGFGESDNGPKGTKREVTYAVNTVNWDENFANVGGNGLGLCTGDSGGPTFLELWDGTWRAFGVSSAIQGLCGAPGIVALMHDPVAWIEQESGFDVSPCHDPDGTWNPGPDCGGVPVDPQTGSGTWPSCDPGELSDKENTCGPPYDAGPDDAPPLVVITDPPDMSQYDEVPSILSVNLTADDGDGWGLADAWLEIDGTQVTVDMIVPGSYTAPDLNFNEGIYELVGYAEDWAGNIGASETVLIAVGTELPMPETTDTDGSETDGDTDGTTTDASGSGSDSGTGSSDGESDAGSDSGETTAGSSGEASDTDGTGAGDSGGQDTDDSGCGCQSGSSPGVSGLALLLLWGLRRRRATGS